MIILAIDPGTTQSAYVVYQDKDVLGAGLIPNEQLSEWIGTSQIFSVLGDGHHEQPMKMYIEMVASYGMPVGKTVFETCVWIGRFIEQWGGDWEYMYRKDVKMYLCNSTRAKDSNIRQALIDRYGGSKAAAIGVKAAQGPLYGFKADMWAALAVAVTAGFRENMTPPF